MAKAFGWVYSSAIIVGIVVVSFFTISMLSTKAKKMEGFNDMGAQIQLATSHVPTEEDIISEKRERKEIMKELRDLTGH